METNVANKETAKSSAKESNSAMEDGFVRSLATIHASLKKSKNLNTKNVKNFGGKENELWCEGGEVEFIKLMIRESVDFQKNCTWFTTLVSKRESITPIYKELEKVSPKSIKSIKMHQGNKKTRVIAWKFS